MYSLKRLFQFQHIALKCNLFYYINIPAAAILYRPSADSVQILCTDMAAGLAHDTWLWYCY